MEWYTFKISNKNEGVDVADRATCQTSGLNQTHLLEEL